jgi:hypothetical protein
LALRAFELANSEPPKEKLVACGNALLEQAYHGESRLAALKAFKAAGDKDKLLGCGNSWLEEGILSMALEAFEAAGTEPPKDKLLACGNTCLKKFEEEGDRSREYD